jgi:PhzF family phenazine biosynthesis protein
MQRPFRQVDVFTTQAYLGNPVAVVLDGAGLSDAAMQAFANWTNLSETTFVLPATDPAADYQLRIFTPRTELPFAGHPTLGSAYAMLEARLVAPRGGVLTQQCKVGLIAVSVPGDWQSAGLSFQLPSHQIDPAPDAENLVLAMGSRGAPVAAPVIVNVGPRWVIAQLPREGDVRSLTPDLAALAAYDRRHGTTGLTVFAPLDGDAGATGGIVVRSFAPTDGLAEDPVCGSGNGSVAAYRLATGAMANGDNYTASQGREMGRDGVVRVAYREGGIHVGGCCITAISGTVEI